MLLSGITISHHEKVLAVIVFFLCQESVRETIAPPLCKTLDTPDLSTTF